MDTSARSSSPAGFLHRLVSRPDAREALAWFVLVALAFPPWRAFEIEGGEKNWELEAWPYAVMAGIALVAIGTLIRALGPHGRTTASGQPRAVGQRDQFTIARSTWFVILCSLAYVTAVGLLGFPVASPLFIAVAIVVQGGRHWPTIIGVAIGLPAIVAVVVVGLCDLPLPLGAGPFLDFSNATFGMSG